MSLSKILLTGLGWALGGPLGGILGYCLGSFIQNAQKQSNEKIPPRQSVHHGPYHNTGTTADIHAALLVLMAAVMKADGVVKRSELDYVKHFLLQNYGEEQAQEMLTRLRDITKQGTPVGAVCDQIKINTDYDTRYHMLDFLFGVACADNILDTSEERILRLIAAGFGINKRDYLSIYTRHAAQSSYQQQYRSNSSYNNTTTTKDPYNVLGITRDATDEEVKKAYRRLAMKYHPDKVEGLGDDVKKNAEAQFREINEAYEKIKSLRNLK